MTNCTNCNFILNEKYCPNCGQVAVLKRIDKHYLQHEFMHLFHLEKGFIYTVWQLITKPGESIRTFLTENRNKLMKPIPFLVFTCLIYALVGTYFDATEINNGMGKIDTGGVQTTATRILKWFQAHFAYANIVISLFMAFLLKILFWKKPYNYFEIMTMLSYVLGVNMLLMTILVVFYSILNTIVFKTLLLLFYYGYSIFAIGQFFDKSKILSFIKAFLAFLFGLVLYFVSIAVVGVSIDQILIK
jgi:Protein of unknown function (DUF3667)